MSRADESSILSFEGKKQSMGHHTSVSYLSPDSIRWMNKRRPKGGSASAVHVLPSRALQLSQIFKGLDFDNSGAIDIEELKVSVHRITINHQPNSIPSHHSNHRKLLPLWPETTRVRKKSSKTQRSSLISSWPWILTAMESWMATSS